VKARLAKVYAEAFLAAAGKQHAVVNAGMELSSFIHDVLNRAPEIEAYLSSPIVGRKAKTAALHAALPSHASELLQGFLAVLARNGRLDLLRGIVAAFHQLLDERAGRTPVKVTSAVELTDTQRETLTQTLAGIMKHEPVLNVRIDPDLIGGLVIQIGDRVIDTSVRTRLRTLRNRLLETPM
jgi:F-type H+-transporting ATPase subunit delta